MRASQVGAREKSVLKKDTKKKIIPTTRPVSKTLEVGEDFNWCEWKEMKKSTIVWLRKKAKAIGEPKDLTNKKIEAVRSQEPEDGHVAVFSHTLSGHKVWDGVVIKKRIKRPTIEFPIR